MRVLTATAFAMASFLGACSDGGNAGDAGGGGGDIAFTRDAATGARYSAPGPRSCSPRNVPAKGPPSPAQAAAYVICDAEKESANSLYLLDKVVVTDVAPGRPHERNERVRHNIDTNQPVYAIRGSMEEYQCTPTYGTPTGTNCAITHSRNAEGDCYLTTFGDWRCMMVDGRAVINEERGKAPPPA